MPTRIVFFHGLESGPHGSKYRALAGAFGEVLSPSFEGVHDVAARIQLAETATREMTRLILVGSSFGGLVAALLASRHPERVAGYVLMAPALHDHWPEAVAEISRIPPLAVVIHGTEDEVVPISAIRAWTRAHQVPLLEVRDGHRLHLATEIMVERVRAFLTETSMTAGR